MAIHINTKHTLLLGAAAAALLGQERQALAGAPGSPGVTPAALASAALPVIPPAGPPQVYYFDLYANRPGEELMIESGGRITSEMFSAFRHDTSAPGIASEIRENGLRAAAKWAVFELLQHYGICDPSKPRLESADDLRQGRLNKMKATLSALRQEFGAMLTNPSLTVEQKEAQLTAAREKLNRTGALFEAEKKEFEERCQAAAEAENPDELGKDALVCRQQAPLVRLLLAGNGYSGLEVWKGECYSPSEMPKAAEDVNHVFVYVPAGAGEPEAIIESTTSPAAAYKKIVRSEEVRGRIFQVTEDGYYYRKTEIVPCRVEAAAPPESSIASHFPRL